MSYIGKTPTIGNFQVCDAIATVNAQAKILDSNVTTAKIADANVTTAKIADANVTLAKLSATGTKNSTTFLRGDNTFDTPPLGGITMADQWRLTANITLTSETAADVTANLERVDTAGQGFIGSAMTESSGIFTFPSTGVYLVSSISQFYETQDARWIRSDIYATVNNSSYTQLATNYGFIQITQSSNTYITVPVSTLVDVTNTSNVKIKFAYSRKDSNNIKVNGSTDLNHTYYTFIRLGDT